MSSIVPLTSSGTLCPLTGAPHLPRFWTKVHAEGKGRLAQNYPGCGSGYDQMVLDALGLGEKKAEVLTAGRTLAYTAFVAELRTLGGNFDSGNIEKLKRAIAGYNHTNETRKAILDAEGLTDAVGIKDAVNLNVLDDLRELYNDLNPAPLVEAKPEPDTEPVVAPVATTEPQAEVTPQETAPEATTVPQGETEKAA